MSNFKTDPPSELQQLLQAYRLEPVGHLLSHLPLPVVWLLFVFLYIGILLILHSVIGTPRPTSLSEMLQTTVYYPNIFAISYDLIGSPLVLVMLTAYRTYIPTQFMQLEREDFIQGKIITSKAALKSFKTISSKLTQKITIIIFPFLLALLLLVRDIIIFPQKEMPALYTLLFLSILSRYARAAVYIQLVYAFIIFRFYNLKFRLHLNHPDQCSGLAPFGNLALAGYLFLFVDTIMQGVGIAVGGSSLWKTLGDAGIILGVFLLGLAMILSQLIYRPHYRLQEFRKKYLLAASTAWTKYHQRTTATIMRLSERSTASSTNKSGSEIDEELKLLEAWTKLDKYVEDMHIWPIPKRTFRLIVLVINPLIPVLLPLIPGVIKHLLP